MNNKNLVKIFVVVLLALISCNVVVKGYTFYDAEDNYHYLVLSGDRIAAENGYTDRPGTNIWWDSDYNLWRGPGTIYVVDTFTDIEVKFNTHDGVNYYAESNNARELNEFGGIQGDIGFYLSDLMRTVNHADRIGAPIIVSDTIRSSESDPIKMDVTGINIPLSLAIDSNGLTAIDETYLDYESDSKHEVWESFFDPETDWSSPLKTSISGLTKKTYGVESLGGNSETVDVDDENLQNDLKRILEEDYVENADEYNLWLVESRLDLKMDGIIDISTENAIMESAREINYEHLRDAMGSKYNNKLTELENLESFRNSLGIDESGEVGVNTPLTIGALDGYAEPVEYRDFNDPEMVSLIEPFNHMSFTMTNLRLDKGGAIIYDSEYTNDIVNMPVSDLEVSENYWTSEKKLKYVDNSKSNIFEDFVSSSKINSLIDDGNFKPSFDLSVWGRAQNDELGGANDGSIMAQRVIDKISVNSLDEGFLEQLIAQKDAVLISADGEDTIDTADVGVGSQPVSMNIVSDIPNSVSGGAVGSSCTI